MAVPLFSIFSEQSAGIGQLTDLLLLAEWCEKCKISILQLLPLNDVGFNFRPYDAQSMFALDPMYLDLAGLSGADPAHFIGDIERLRRQFRPALKKARVDYRIKQEKLDLLWRIYASRPWEDSADFHAYRQQNLFWLDDYTLFKVLKEKLLEQHWQAWPPEFKNRVPAALQEFRLQNPERLQYHAWLQWQLAEQFRRVKDVLGKRGLWLMGDIPFLVSGDSADVWAKQEYFKLDLAAGAPPDYYLASGQRWGMPPYNWDAIAGRQYDYLVQKLQYAQNFYDLYRIDHFVGIFRLWTVPVSEPLASGGLHGRFDPPDESQWEEHGKKLLRVMLNSSSMLPCAEDLGTIPPCSYKVLEEFGIVGMDIQRWSRDWNRTYQFNPPETYRTNSIATISTHDMTPLRAWWENEAGTVDEWLFERKCRERGLDFQALKERLFETGKSRHRRLRWKREINSVDLLLWHLQRPAEQVRDFIDLYLSSYHEQEQFWKYLGLPGEWQEAFSPALALKALEVINQSNSIFSIQLLQEWLAFTARFDAYDAWELRINWPGSTSDKNWSLVMPFSLEDLLAFPENLTLRKLNEASGRL